MIKNYLYNKSPHQRIVNQRDMQIAEEGKEPSLFLKMKLIQTHGLMEEVNFLGRWLEANIRLAMNLMI